MNNEENLAEVAVLGGVKVVACLKGKHNSTLGVLVLPQPQVSMAHTGWGALQNQPVICERCMQWDCSKHSAPGLRDSALVSCIPLPILHALAIEIAGCLGLLARETYHQVTTQYLEPSWQMPRYRPHRTES